MKIIVLEGSPNQHGSSNMLADNFIRGAEEAGHTVKVIDAAHADIHPCIGCIHCRPMCAVILNGPHYGVQIRRASEKTDEIRTPRRGTGRLFWRRIIRRWYII